KNTAPPGIWYASPTMVSPPLKPMLNAERASELVIMSCTIGGSLIFRNSSAPQPSRPKEVIGPALPTTGSFASQPFFEAKPSAREPTTIAVRWPPRPPRKLPTEPRALLPPERRRLTGARRTRAIDGAARTVIEVDFAVEARRALERPPPPFVNCPFFLRPLAIPPMAARLTDPKNPRQLWVSASTAAARPARATQLPYQTPSPCRPPLRAGRACPAQWATARRLECS